MSENIPYIIAENGYYYVAYKEKAPVPEIVVSSKGVANGLSEEYNDGWDFGPDSYSSTSTSAIPYTQTSGIQEACNYAISSNISTIRCIGHFKFSNLNLNVGYNVMQGISEPVCIFIPLIDASTSPLVVLNIIGDGTEVGTYETNNANAMGYNTTQGTIFEITDTSDYRTYDGVTNNFTNGVLFGTGNASSYYAHRTNVLIKFKDITFLSPNNGLPHTNIDGSQFAGLEIDNCTFGISMVDTQNITEPDTDAGVGVIFPATGNLGISISKNIAVAGYYYGVIYASHFFADALRIYNCHYGILPLNGYHPAQIFYLDIEMCVYNIVASEPNTQTTNPVGTAIYVLDIQKALPSTDAWCVNKADVYADGTISGITFNLNVSFLIQNTATEGLQPSTLAIDNVNPSNVQLNININSSIIESLTPAITTPSIPASGSSSQNTNLYAVKVYVNGGALTEIQISINGTSYTVYSNSTASAVYEGFTLPAGASITLTYTTAPTWSWLPE